MSLNSKNKKVIKFKYSMDSIFGLGGDERTAFLRHMMQSLGSTYVCLWSYSTLPSNCLKSLDGIYQEERNLEQASSSSGSFARRLFEAYCGSLYYVDLGYVPGFVFKNNLPYMEMNIDYLRTIAHTEMQLQFYQEAGIKTLVFMGCAMGEIELGFSNAPQVNLELEMRKWFPLDFSRQTHAQELPHLINQTLIPTPSPSLSLDSIEIDCSSSLFDVIPTPASFTTEPLTLVQNSQVPTTESEDAEMARAFLAVLSASTTTSSCSQNTPPVGHARAAFTRYRALGLGPVRAPIRHKQHGNLFARAVLFYRKLSTRRTLEGNVQTPTQMHHVIQERRRREKLNESFQVLKALVPQLSKKDKASVLSSTTEYLTSLKSQVEQLTNINHVLEEQLSKTTQRSERGDHDDEELGLSSITCSTERVYVEIERVPKSTSGEKLVDLRVRLRSGECGLVDLISGVLKMLQKHTNIRLCVMQSNTRKLESTQLHTLILRLKVEGNDFDETGLQEAVRRVVGDLPN